MPGRDRGGDAAFAEGLDGTVPTLLRQSWLCLPKERSLERLGAHRNSFRVKQYFNRAQVLRKSGPNAADPLAIFALSFYLAVFYQVFPGRWKPLST